MPPAEIVSTPSSSASATASSTASGSPMPTSGPSANALSYSTRAEPPLLVRRIRSQPIEHDAQESRTAARSSSASSVVSAPKLWPGSAESALKASRLESVPASRYLAVAGPKERARSALEAASTAGASWTGARRWARTATAFRRLEPITAPSPPRPAWRPSCETVAKRTSCSPAGPIAATRYAGRAARAAPPPRRRPSRPQRSPAGSSRTPCSSTISVLGASQAPRTTIASLPVPLPAIAKWLDASASLSRSVSGDFATTANFALVVSGVPTSGEKTKASGASGASGSPPSGPSSPSRWVPRPGAADRAAQDVVAQRERLRAPVAEVHDQGPAEVAARRHASSVRV